jgi:hypothetical protein
MVAVPLPPPPKVFLSYSHDSPEHMDRVLELCDRLRAGGVDAWLDQYETAPEEGWPRWCARRVAEADFVLVVCTEVYERRFRGAEAPGTGLGVSWEVMSPSRSCTTRERSTRSTFPCCGLRPARSRFRWSCAEPLAMTSAVQRRTRVSTGT